MSIPVESVQIGCTKAGNIPNGPPGVLSPKLQVLFVAFGAVITACLISHGLAAWFDLKTATPKYRRIGPSQGPQIFCAGSSVLQFGLSWPKISEALGQGIENWGLAGSSPEIWETSQSLATNANRMILGISVHDLNEYYLCDSRANIVDLDQTVRDLWQLKSDWTFSQRLLAQYPLAWMRVLFPTAGKSDAVLVGLRRKLRSLTGSSATADDKANFLVLPNKPVLDFGDSNERMSDWPHDKAIRRLALLRNEIRGKHDFHGPKRLALFRLLGQASKRGEIIMVMMPVAPTYSRELLTPEDVRNCEKALADLQQAAPQAQFVRLDHLPNLNSDEYFSDFVHLNAAGRRLVTEAFLEKIAKNPSRP